MSSSINGFDRNRWIEGAKTDGNGMLVWRTADRGTFVWQTADFETWSRGVIRDDDGVHIRDVSRVGDGWVAVGSSDIWVSSDAMSWVKSAGREDFATDAVSPATPILVGCTSRMVTPSRLLVSDTSRERLVLQGSGGLPEHRADGAGQP